MDGDELKNQLKKWVESQPNIYGMFNVSTTLKFNLSSDKLLQNETKCSTSESNSGSGLKAEQIAAIVVGILIVIGVVLAPIIVLRVHIRRKVRREQSEDQYVNIDDKNEKLCTKRM